MKYRHTGAKSNCIKVLLMSPERGVKRTLEGGKRKEERKELQGDDN